MRVGIFYTSFAFAPNKVYLMDCFKLGVVANGDTAIDFRQETQRIENIDAAFILGYSYEQTYRRKIIDHCEKKGISPIYVDSNIFVYGTINTNHYHRYSVNGIFKDDGEYFLGREPNPQRTQEILKYHKIDIKPWRSNGDYILILGQRTKSWNFGDKNGLDWIFNIVPKVRAHTDRKIVIRLHPGDTKFNAKNLVKLKEHFGDSVIISKEPSIKKDLEKSWCCVGYNSTPTSVSAMEGVPVYIDDPKKCWASDIGFSNLSQIENPPMPDRESWINKLAMIHWNNAEIKNGDFWESYKKFYNIL